MKAVKKWSIRALQIHFDGFMQSIGSFINAFFYLHTPDKVTSKKDNSDRSHFDMTHAKSQASRTTIDVVF